MLRHGSPFERCRASVTPCRPRYFRMRGAGALYPRRITRAEMRVLFLHVDYLEYEVKEKAVKGLPDLPKEARHGRAEEALVCFISAEKRDEANPIGAAKAAAENIEDVASQVRTRRVVLDTKGEARPLSIKDGTVAGFDFKGHDNLRRFALYEMMKSREVKEEPPHVRLMRDLELVDYEPGSDPGNLRYYPKGRLIKGLIEEYVTQRTREYGAMEVECPVMYDFEHPALKSYLNRFPARQYVVQTPNKKTFLRFSACFGQFLIMKDMVISYKQLPLSLYELTRYSFPAEQRGEGAGLRRLRGFPRPDCHPPAPPTATAKEGRTGRRAVA